MPVGQDWAVLVAVQHGGKPRSVSFDETRLRETRQLVARALAVASPATTFALIAPRFLDEWTSLANTIPRRNLVAPPIDSSALIGITRILQVIRTRDANARVILIPADHCAAIEDAWVRSAQGALALVERQENAVYLLHDQTHVELHAFDAAQEFCSTTVIVGSATALIELCEGNRSTKVFDLMTNDLSALVKEESDNRGEVDARSINLVHVRLVEEYERIQKGTYGLPASLVHVVA